MYAEAQTKRKIQDGRADFDFLFGTWHGRNRRLRERLDACELHHAAIELLDNGPGLRVVIRFPPA